METLETVFSNEEISAFGNLGYCDMGDGYVARTPRGGGRNALANNPSALKKAGLTWNQLQLMTDNRQIEHLARKYCAKSIFVGEAFASQMLPSEVSMTYYIHGDPEDHENFQAAMLKVNMMADRLADIEPAAVVKKLHFISQTPNPYLDGAEF